MLLYFSYQYWLLVIVFIAAKAMNIVITNFYTRLSQTGRTRSYQHFIHQLLEIKNLNIFLK
ncbi:hypothetical protein DWY52_17570 [Bacteroides stercoris]|uniref:Uncharacterized protein n=1 Tax=Bacteroides stercoris TaxID=46506 RepID=A0A3E4UQI8_BACSE|nr:hypothetical protein DXC34_07760 [Bacteroides stercoris]RGR31626.1 hypothetical protein DWY52_17570 [Bacteroides stercoris]